MFFSKDNKRSVKLVVDNKLMAVHDDDIPTLFKSLNIYDDFISGKYKCYFCKHTITTDNFMAILPVEKEIELCCNLPECYKKLIELGECDE